MLLGRDCSELTDNSEVQLNKFLFKVFFQQLVIVVFALATACSYLYFHHANQIKENQKKLESIINYNFNRYHQMIDMMQAKMQSANSDTKAALNTTKYNKFLGCGKFFVDVSGSYLVEFEDSKPMVISEYGKEDFAILPEIEFLPLLAHKER